MASITRPTSLSESLFEYDEAAQDMDLQLWGQLLKRFTKLTGLTIRAHGNPIWPGTTHIELQILQLRIILEDVQHHLPQLQNLTLTPIHLFGIIHLRWSGFGAFKIVPDIHTSTRLWQNITNLSIQLHNPNTFAATTTTTNPNTTTSPLTRNQYVMSLKILHSYLCSFSFSLHTLQFIWLDAPGPSPMLLDTEIERYASDNDGSTAPPQPPQRHIQWHALRELRFGNIAEPYRTAQLLPDRAPNVTVLKALRSTLLPSTQAAAAALQDLGAAAWVDVAIGRDVVRRGHPAYAASSIYSQSERGDGEEWDGLYDGDGDGGEDNEGRSSRTVSLIGGQEKLSRRSVYIPPRTAWRRLTDRYGRPLSTASSTGRR